jgi:hypothetical protein
MVFSPFIVCTPSPMYPGNEQDHCPKHNAITTFSFPTLWPLKPFYFLQKYKLAISNPALETCVHYQTGGAGDNPSFLSVTLANLFL